MDRNPNKDALVQELITVGGFLFMLYMSKKVMTPDFGRALRMKGALTLKRVADIQVEMWQRVANNAATNYQNARL